MLRIVLAAATAMLFLACGSRELGHGSVNATRGATLSVPGGPSLFIPAGALAGDTTVRLRQTKTAIGDADVPFRPVGPSVDVDLGGTSLRAPVFMELPFSPESLPKGFSRDSIVGTYFDTASRSWIVLPSRVDPARDVVLVRAEHFSVLQPAVASDLQRLTQDILSGKFLAAVGSSVGAACTEQTDKGQVSNQDGYNVIRACITTGRSDFPAFEVQNLRSFHLAVTVDAGKTAQRTMMAPGERRVVRPLAGDPAPARATSRIDQATLTTFFLQCVVHSLGGKSAGSAQNEAAFALLNGAVEGVLPQLYTTEPLSLQAVPRATEDMMLAFKRPEQAKAILASLNAFGKAANLPGLATVNLAQLTQTLDQMEKISFAVSVVDFMNTALQAKQPDVTMMWSDTALVAGGQLKLSITQPDPRNSRVRLTVTNTGRDTLTYRRPEDVVELRKSGSADVIKPRTTIVSDRDHWKSGESFPIDVVDVAPGSYVLSVRLLDTKGQSVTVTSPFAVNELATSPPQPAPALPTVATAQSNLLSNASFEAGANGWPAGWNNDGPRGTYEWPATPSHTGSAAVRYGICGVTDRTGQIWGSWEYSTRIPIDSSRPLKVSFWQRLAPGSREDVALAGADFSFRAESRGREVRGDPRYGSFVTTSLSPKPTSVWAFVVLTFDPVVLRQSGADTITRLRWGVDELASAPECSAAAPGLLLDDVRLWQE